MGSTESIVPKLITILNEPDKKTAKLYALNNLRKLKYFPNKIELLKKLLTSKSWEIRTETANTACYFPFKNKDEVELYLKLLNDKNPNVSRTAAIALKKIKYSQNKNWLKSKIENLLQNEDLTINGRGELLITYASLFKISAEDIIDEYDDLVKEKFIYRMMANNVTDPKFNYEYLIEQIPESNEAELLDLLPAYLALQNNFINNRKYAQYLFTVLQSNKPSSVSIIADGLELPLIHNYQEVLHELIIAHVFKDKNNAQYSEAIISLAKLAYKLDSKFYDSVIDMLASSQLYSVKKYAMEKQGVSNTIQKDEKLFNQLWNFAFRYKHATITTNKGNFKIGLKPEFAPITCASFTALVKKDFYDNVTFHRVVPNFVIQTGDTMNTGWGGPEYEIISEFSPLPFKKGAVGIASIGKDTEGSQWFVMHSLFPHLNGRYTNWAEVIEKINIVDIIDEGDRIINIVLE
jgi:cyclophilin family peptidyl-prolyl cis-trans isomerase